MKSIFKTRDWNYVNPICYSPFLQFMYRSWTFLPVPDCPERKVVIQYLRSLAQKIFQQHYEVVISVFRVSEWTVIYFQVRVVMLLPIATFSFLHLQIEVGNCCTNALHFTDGMHCSHSILVVEGIKIQWWIWWQKETDCFVLDGVNFIECWSCIHLSRWRAFHWLIPRRWW